jgi:hypothetical protein
LSSYWETARRILSGKPRGSKLIVLGVFLTGVGVGLAIALSSYQPSGSAVGATSVFWFLGIVAFMRGVALYEKETEIELQKKQAQITSSS